MTDVLSAETGSAAGTRELAAALAPILRPGDVIALIGDLGAGKTVWTQGLAAALGITERVTSPTFTLVKSYDGRLALHHVDAYRLSGPADLADLGYEEWLFGDGVTVIEWADRVAALLPPERLDIEFQRRGPDEHRELHITPVGGDWSDRALKWLGGVR